MKTARIILVGIFFVAISAAHADIASVQYVQSILSSLEVQADWNQSDTNALDYIKNKPDVTDASNLTSGTVAIGRLPVGTTANTVAAGDDSRFYTIPTTEPSGNAPNGTVFIWFD